MCLILANLLHDTQEVDAREEISPGELGDGLGRLFCSWVA